MPRLDDLFKIPGVRKAWLAGHKNKITDGVSVRQICKNLKKYKRKFPLNVSAVLNVGTARIYAAEVDELYQDTLKLNKDMILRRIRPANENEDSAESTSESVSTIGTGSRSGLSPSLHPRPTTQSRSTSLPEQSTHFELDAGSSPQPLSTSLPETTKSKHEHKSSVNDISTGHEVMPRADVVSKVPGVRKAWLAGHTNKISRDGISSLETCKVLKKYKRKFSLHKAVVQTIGAARIYDAELDELFQDTVKLDKGIIRRRRPAEETEEPAESTSESASPLEPGSQTESPQQLKPSGGSTTQSGSTSRPKRSSQSGLDSSLQSKSSQETLSTSQKTLRSSTPEHLSESSTDESYSPLSPDLEDHFEQYEYDYEYEYEDVSSTFTYRTNREHESRTLRQYFYRRKLSTISEVRTSSDLEKCEAEEQRDTSGLL